MRCFAQITDNLAVRSRLDEAAAIIGMTPSGLSWFFLRAAGSGFAHTVRRLRVIRACTLLFRTDRPIAEVGFDAGYQNLSNFNRQFRAEDGMTPREYRTRFAPESPAGFWRPDPAASVPKANRFGHQESVIRA